MRPADQVAALASESLEDDILEIDNRAIVRRQIVGAMPTAINAIINLAAHASNEKLRFEASKWIIERGAPVDKEAGAASPIDRLIADINKATGN